MHSGEIVPSFHSAFVSHSPRGSSQSESAFFAMWVSLLRNSDLPYLACSGSSSISWSANLRSGVTFFFLLLCFRLLVCQHTLEGGGGESFRPYPGPRGGTDVKFGVMVRRQGIQLCLGALCLCCLVVLVLKFKQ